MSEPEMVQRAYTTIIRYSVDHGIAPHYTELAASLGVTPDEARGIQEEAAKAGVGCWISHDTDYIHSFAPFSNLPTQYRISIEGVQKWWGQ